MKKILIIIATIFLLTSCYSNPEDTKKIEELENKIKTIINLNNEKNINLKDKIIELENEVIELKNTNNELLKNIKIKETNTIKNTNNDIFNKNIKCNNLKGDILKNLHPQESLSELFFSPSKNSCIKGTILINGNGEMAYLLISDAITGNNINIYDCSKDKNCLIQFNKNLQKLKN